MVVKLALLKDTNDIMLIYKNARIRMINEGNLTQWDNYDEFKDEIVDYINKKILYIVLENKEIVGCFAYFYSGESAYQIIKGKWLNENQYVTIHKIASKYNNKGIGTFILNYIKKEIVKNNVFDIKIDTHENNISMQKFLSKHGFIKCGTISLILDFNNNKSLRLAYQLHLS